GPRQPLALEPDLEDGRGVRVRRGARGLAVPVGGRPRPRTGGWGPHLQPLRRLRSVPRGGGVRGGGPRALAARRAPRRPGRSPRHSLPQLAVAVSELTAATEFRGTVYEPPDLQAL